MKLSPLLGLENYHLKFLMELSPKGKDRINTSLGKREITPPVQESELNSQLPFHAASSTPM